MSLSTRGKSMEWGGFLDYANIYRQWNPNVSCSPALDITGSYTLSEISNKLWWDWRTPRRPPYSAYQHPLTTPDRGSIGRVVSFHSIVSTLIKLSSHCDVHRAVCSPTLFFQPPRVLSILSNVYIRASNTKRIRWTRYVRTLFELQRWLRICWSTMVLRRYIVSFLCFYPFYFLFHLSYITFSFIFLHRDVDFTVAVTGRRWVDGVKADRGERYWRG